MEVCVASIVQNLDPPAELTNDLLTIAEPVSGKTLIEIAVILGTSFWYIIGTGQTTPRISITYKLAGPFSSATNNTFLDNYMIE